MKFTAAICLWVLAISYTYGQSCQERFEFEAQKMGTTFKLVFYDSSYTHAQEAAQAAFQRVDQLNMVFSDYRADSELSALSQTAGSGQRVKVSTDLWRVLVASRLISRKSYGAFDISIGPLSKLWRRAFRQRTFPDINQVQHAKTLVNYKWIKLHNKTKQVELLKKGMKLDLGGIAKGYTVDEVYKILGSYGISSKIVDGGGDLMVGALPPNGKPWIIKTLDSPSPVTITNQALASSGASYQYLEWEGKRYSHIIDPRSGLGISETDNINIVANNCMMADALASTVSLLPTKSSKKLLRAFSAYQLAQELSPP